MDQHSIEARSGSAMERNVNTGHGRGGQQVPLARDLQFLMTSAPVCTGVVGPQALLGPQDSRRPWSTGKSSFQ